MNATLCLVRMPGQRGFTLVELMVAIAVIAILLMIAVPSFQEAALGSQLRAVANDLVASTHLARSEAIKRNTAVTLCASADGQACDADASWREGWIVACRSNDGDNCVAGGAIWMLLQRQQAAPLRLNITGTNNRLNFQPIGVGAAATTFTICRAGDGAGSQQREVTVDASGRASVRRTVAGVDGCS